MSSKPKTGQKRKTRQPLKIDKLPMEMRDRIQQLRAEGKTWEEIEELSASFPGWDKLPLNVLELFPDKRIPRSTLHRWYDIRVDQVAKEIAAETFTAREFANVFADREFEELPNAIVNAIRDQCFTLLKTNDRGEKLQAIKMLGQLGRLVADKKRTDLKEQQIGIEKRRQESQERILEVKLQEMQERVKKLKEEVGDSKKQLSPEELQQKLDQIYGLGH